MLRVLQSGKEKRTLRMSEGAGRKEGRKFGEVSGEPVVKRDRERKRGLEKETN